MVNAVVEESSSGGAELTATSDDSLAEARRGLTKLQESVHGEAESVLGLKGSGVAKNEVLVGRGGREGEESEMVDIAMKVVNSSVAEMNGGGMCV